MSDYRRFRDPGGTYFLTVNLLERRADLLVRHIDEFREAVRRARAYSPLFGFHVARSEHLPIYKAAYDRCLYLEQVVRGFSRYHKYGLGG